MLTTSVFKEFKFRHYVVQHLCWPGYYDQNSYVLIDLIRENQYVVDPGNGFEYLKLRINDNGIPLKSIILTHGHFDHAGAASSLGEYFSVPVCIHSADVKLLNRAPAYSYVFNKTKMAVPANITPAENENFGTLSILHTPGHTPGSICVCSKDFIFTGDTILKGEYGRTDLPGGNAVQLKKSVHLLSEKLRDGWMVFPGHGEPFLFRDFKIQDTH